MNYTTNYNLNKPEGTDLYNHLTIDNPNMDTIDAAMYANKLQAIGSATELVSGTVHAITRGSADQNIFKFKATGNFNLGDTITVDGVTVNAYTTAGQQLPEDAYVLSAEVLCILDGTSLWVLTNTTELPASNITYDNTSSGLSATDAQAAIDEIDNTVDEITRGLQGSSVEITGYNAPNNTYTCPSDGYIMTVLPAATNGKVEVSLQPNGIVAWTTLPDSTNAVYGALFVKKNTQVYVSTNTVTTAKVLFRY